MKKLFGFLTLALSVSFVFTSCNKELEPKHPTHLNTSSGLVGQLYGATGLVDNVNDAQGIIFAVDDNNAYLIAFTELYTTTKRGGNLEVCAVPTKWSASYFETGAKSKDGSENTDMILAVANDTADAAATAARKCREYYKKNLTGIINKDVLDGDTAWKYTQGEWYLPSAEELDALMRVKDKLNALYEGTYYEYNGRQIVDGPNDKYYTNIGLEEGYAYWSSTEENAKTAWYDLPNSNDDNYGSKTWSYEGGKGRIYVRPIRKVALP